MSLPLVVYRNCQRWFDVSLEVEHLCLASTVLLVSARCLLFTPICTRWSLLFLLLSTTVEVIQTLQHSHTVAVYCINCLLLFVEDSFILFRLHQINISAVLAFSNTTWQWLMQIHVKHSVVFLCYRRRLDHGIKSYGYNDWKRNINHSSKYVYLV